MKWNSINHDYLKDKMNDLGFSESAFEMVHSFINNRQQKTLVKKN